jgi:hypothetical protein
VGTVFIVKGFWLQNIFHKKYIEPWFYTRVMMAETGKKMTKTGKLIRERLKKGWKAVKAGPLTV